LFFESLIINLYFTVAYQCNATRKMATLNDRLGEYDDINAIYSVRSKNTLLQKLQCLQKE